MTADRLDVLERRARARMDIPGEDVLVLIERIRHLEARLKFEKDE